MADDCCRGEVQRVAVEKYEGAGWLSAHGRGEIKCRNEGRGGGGGSFLW